MVSIIPVCLVLTLSAAAAQAGMQQGVEVISESLEKHLRSMTPRDETSVLVVFRDSLEASAYQRNPGVGRSRLIRHLKYRAGQDQKTAREFLMQQGVTRVNSLWINNTMAFSANASLIRHVARLPEVESIRTDTVLRLEVVDLPSVQPNTSQWQLDAVGVPDLWRLGYDGTGIVVANMDTGVDLNHPDLIDRWRGGQNSWKDVHGRYPLPYDYDGHGTATMGIMVGGNHSGSFIGAAPGARWIAVKIFDDNGQAPFSKIHEGFQWLLDPDGDPDTPDAPDIINNSWGLYLSVNKCINEFQRDIDTLRAAGIALVFAAGNAGPVSSTSVSPANNRNSVSVGAVDEDGSLALFSSRGPSPCGGSIFPSLTAPGVNIKTADLTGGGAIPDSYTYVSGTSYATALVSGGMALLMSAMQEKNVTQLEKMVLLSSSDAGPLGPDDQFGNGILDMRIAYEYLSNICPEDFDQDFAVGPSDLTVFWEDWLRPECIACTGDLNGDHVVDLQDFSLFAERFGRNPCPSKCSGDIDFDFDVSLSDLSILAGEWLSLDCPDCQSDISGDGNIDFQDFFALALQFGRKVCQ